MVTEVQELQRVIDNLEMQLQTLRDLLKIPETTPWDKGMTKTEARAWECLSEGKIIPRELIYDAMYYDCNDAPPEVKIVDVYIHKLRSKLRKHKEPWWIQTVWGRGYTIHKIDPSFWDEVPNIKGMKYSGMEPDQARKHAATHKKAA